MRIGLVSYEYPPQKGMGGVGTYMFRLAGALGQAGCEVVVLTGPSDEAEIPQKNVTVHRIQKHFHPRGLPRALRFLYWHAFAPLMEWANPLVWHWLRWDFASCAALLEIEKRTPLDVIEAPEHAANGLYCAQMKRWPTVIRVHGPWDLFFGINRTNGSAMNRIITRMERASAEAAQLVTTPSRTMSAYIQERWRMASLPMTVPNFMDVPAEAVDLPDSDGPQNIVCAGRLERFKGQDTLVQAFSRIAGRHPQAHLWLIGPDQWSSKFTFSSWVDSVVNDGTIRQRIHLPGRQSIEQVQQALAGAAVAVVCSSGFESFSFSTLEAMAAARPIVASRVGAIPELLADGRCGLIAAPGNVQQFADALDRLLCDRSLSQSLGIAAHARALSQYDSKAAIGLFIESYQEAYRRFHRGRKARGLTPLSCVENAPGTVG